MTWWLQGALIAQYAILGVAALFEQKYWLATYWIGACILTVGVVGGMD